MYLGIDLGSRTVKFVRHDGQAVTEKHSFSTVDFYRDYGRMEGGELSVAFDRLGITPEAGRLTVTGYGRNTVRVKGAEVIPEVKAHMLGAVTQTGLKEFTLLDIGGQYTKVIKVSSDMIEDFAMNDKCAASSGRYIENMAAILNMSLDDISRYSDNPVKLSATCAIFGESEIIQKIAEGVPPEELAAVVNLTIVKRVLPMLNRFKGGPILFSGGVARNGAVANLLRLHTKREVTVLPEPVFNGAIGCAVSSLT